VLGLGIVEEPSYILDRLEYLMKRFLESDFHGV
jgi:hypothetical protein